MPTDHGRRKRALVISDFHCGHKVGLTHPDHQYGRGNPEVEALQMRLWNFYVASMQPFKPFDVVLANGDLLDGKGGKSEGVELIETDLNKQAEMSCKALLETECDTVWATHGTPYHVGIGADDEDKVIDKLKLKGVNAFIEDHGRYEINGVKINMRHNVGSSSIPHGGATPVLKEGVWNLAWALEGDVLADVFIRSHVHNAFYAFDGNRHFVVTPALQGLGSKGARKWSKVVHFGITVLDFYEDGNIDYHCRKLNGQATPCNVRTL